MAVSIFISVVIAPAVFVFLSPPSVVVVIALGAIVGGIRQDGEDQCGCEQGADLTNGIVKFEVSHTYRSGIICPWA